jgi:hypothetical protein
LAKRQKDEERATAELTDAHPFLQKLPAPRCWFASFGCLVRAAKKTLMMHRKSADSSSKKNHFLFFVNKIYFV